MKDDIAVASVIFTIVAVMLLVLVDSGPAVHVLEDVSSAWFASWTAADARYLEPPVVTGHRTAPEPAPTAVATADSRREANVRATSSR